MRATTPARGWLTAGCASALMLAGAGPGAGDEIGIDDRRISDVGGLGDAAYDAIRPAVAYNSTDHEYLVVWAADDVDRGLVDDEYEICGQRLDAATGAEVGELDFLVSTMGGVGDPDDRAGAPAVAYNSVENEYLVVWEGTEDDQGTIEGEYEIYVQRLDAATGEPVGTNNQRISTMGGLGGALYHARSPAVAFDPERNQYLVTWHGSHDQGGQAVGEFEIFVQRLDGATGAEIGIDDQRISSIGGVGDADFDAFDPAVVYNAVHDEFLVVWEGDESGLFQTDEEMEVFVQRLDAATGAEVGDDDFRVTFAGPNLDPDFDAFDPALAHDPVADRYLLVWYGDDDTPPLVEEELEIWSQLLEGANANLIGSPVRLSEMGPPGTFIYRALRPQVAWGSVDGEFLVVWEGSDDPPGEDQFEIFLQRVGPDGLPRGLDDERLSTMGPEGTPDYGAAWSDLAFNPLHDEALVVWVGDDDAPPLLQGEHEVYCQRWIQPLLFADGFESGDASEWSVVLP
ncbi:MAG: hypothetical protein F9K16_04520 [Thermoanaerobaculia bacterium]|nr:MAG: hypothetical protein F9K16_04520 [Thermoanaerobaculia bacterium]MBZ0100712.1 hypothetical protein [Thermoanaerobaculia bacterium]